MTVNMVGGTGNCEVVPKPLSNGIRLQVIEACDQRKIRESAGRQPWGNFTSVTGVGYGSQRLFVIPEKKLSITSLAGNYGTGHRSVSSLVMPEVVRASP